MYDLPHLDLPPLHSAAGTVRLPGSKSISNRVLLLAGLAEGTTELVDLLDSDDTRVMLDALRTLGCAVRPRAPGVLAVTGIGGRLPVQQAELFLGNAGTAMRPLAAALALLSTLHGGDFQLSGVPRMHERPIADLVDALRQLGCTVAYTGQAGYPPLRLSGQAGGRLATAGEVRVRGDVSSQFLTALLLALPLACASAPVSVVVEGELVSKPYVEITLNLLQRFGIAVERDGFARFTLPAGSRYRSPGRLPVEADASSASYFIAAGALAAVQAPIVIEGLGLASIQGDIRFIDAARAMGAQIDGEANRLVVRRGAWPLKAITRDCNAIPDAAMTLAVMAMFADGPTRLTHIGSWRVKETDRIAAMATECRKLGAQAIEGPDWLEIHPPSAWRAAAIDTYDDHRVAMCFSLAAFNPLAAKPGAEAPVQPDGPASPGALGASAAPIPAAAGVPVRIRDPRCVGKTFPDYFEAFFAVAQARADALPVLTIDGPTASGKGTLAAAVAKRLGFHLLDSGLLYRAAALASMRQGLAADDAQGLATMARAMALRFEGDAVWLDGDEVSAALREEAVGNLASRISALPALRTALHALQLAFARLPGLVADGRDMGTVVFPQARLKVFLTASADQRAERRHKQLISKGIPATLGDLRADLEARDARDKARSVAPLKPAEDALLLDNSALSIDASVEQVLAWWAQRLSFQAP